MVHTALTPKLSAPHLGAILPRVIRLGFFRIHLDNGLSVAAGLTLVGLGFGLALGFPAAIAATTGSLCVSVVDQPDPLRQKPWILASAIVPTALATLIVALADASPWRLLAATAFVGLWTGLLSVYGKRAMGVGVATVLAFVFGLGAGFHGAPDALSHLQLFVGGALAYATYAQLAAVALDGRLRRLLLTETLLALAQYLRAKAMMYDPDIAESRALGALIGANADLAERIQAARDGLFLHSRAPSHFRQIEILIGLLDAFEVSLSGDADIQTLRASRYRALTGRIRASILAMADDAEAMIPAAGGWRGAGRTAADGGQPESLAKDVADLAEAADTPEIREELAAFRATAAKLAHADAALLRLRAALDPGARLTGVGANLDLAPFAQDSRITLAALRSQLTLRAPALRYAIRLSCALSAGMVLTLAFPRLVHGGWVLLTTALIMRANYSVTRRRRRDRLIGTLGGCVLAVGLIDFAPPTLMLAVIIVSIGVSHAYATINYRITALAASVTALLLLHTLAPATHPLLLQRLVDTLVGAGLSYGFSFLLPNWARDGLPGAIAAMLEADAAFAAQALARDPVDQAYRLARKKALDAGVALVRLVRDLADEPGANRRSMEILNDLLGANYLLASDLASVQVLLRARGAELTPASAAAWIDEARAAVIAALAGSGAPPEAPLRRRSIARLATDDAMTALGRRLAHAEQGARRVARLAHAASAGARSRPPASP